MNRSRWAALLLLTAVPLTYIGQHFLPNKISTGLGLLLGGTGLLLFLWLLTVWPQPLPPANLPATPAMKPALFDSLSRYWQLILLELLLLLAALAFRLLANNQFTPLGTAVWLTAVFLFLLSFWQLPQKRRSRRRLTWEHGALVAILLLGFWFRFYDLAALPLDMWSDQAEKLLDVNDLLHGARPIFFVRNTGREAVQFYMTAVFVWLTRLPLSFMVLKLGTATVGLLALPFTYLLGRLLFGRGVGLTAAFLLAISHWHVAISRLGLRFPFTAAFATPALYFLLRALQQNRRNDWLAAGIFLGIGLHTYIPMRIVPLLLLALVLLQLLRDVWKRWRAAAPSQLLALRRDFWLRAVAGGALALLLFLPLLRFMADFPQLFWLRVSSRTELTAAVWPIFWQNVLNAALMFNYRGDVVVTNTIPGSPVLDSLTGALFLLGVLWLLVQLIGRRERRALWLFVLLFGLLLPSILSFSFPGENPSVVRAGGAVPLVMIMAALPLPLLWQRLSPVLGQRLALLVIIVGLGTAVQHNYQWYFVDYRDHYTRTIWNTAEMGAVARDFAAEHGGLSQVYHIAYPYWADTRLIGIQAGEVTWENSITSIEQLEDHANHPAPRLYILHPDDITNRDALQKLFPHGELTRYKSSIPYDKDFLLFTVQQIDIGE